MKRIDRLLIILQLLDYCSKRRLCELLYKSTLSRHLTDISFYFESHEGVFSRL